MLISKFLTVVAGVVAAVFCYAVIGRVAGYAGIVHGPSSLTVVDMVSANIGAIAAAAMVALWPAEKQSSVFEAFTTWALATIVLMFMAAPQTITPHHGAILQAAR